MGPTIHMRGGVRIYGTPGVFNNFLLQEPTYIKPKERAAKEITSSGALASFKIGANLLCN